MKRRYQITVVEPYLAQYRVPFYECLAGDLARRGIGLTVAHGQPTGVTVRRGDNSTLPGAVPLTQRTFRVGGKELLWRGLGQFTGRTDAFVLSQALRYLDSYSRLVHARLGGGPAVALFGHGGTRSGRPGALSRAAKTALTRSAEWFFAYTDEGARHVTREGFPADRVTVVGNSIDTTALAAAVDRVSPALLNAFRREHGLREGVTGLYIGGLDTFKRIPFLLAAAERTADRVPGFRLLVAGDGEDRGLVKRAGNHVVYLGRVSGEAKALAGAAADVLMLPGAVGLAAVDSFALRAPLVTMADAEHGPEFGYLEHERNALIVSGGVPEYAAAVAGLLERPELLGTLRRSCRLDATRYTVEGMSARYADGIERLLAFRYGYAPRYASR